MDWVSLLGNVAGILATIFVAGWYFFQQQKVSLSSIDEKLGRIVESGKYLDLQLVLQQLGRLEKNIDHLKESVSQITHSVTNKTREQQDFLLKALQEEHAKHAKNSRDHVVRAIRKEVERISIDDKKLDSVVEQIADLAESAVITMSKHLETNYSENTKLALTQVEETVRVSMNEILSEVSGFREQVSEIPIVRESRRSNRDFRDGESARVG